MPVTQHHLDQAVALARAHGATRLLLFGSAAHAPETARDLDLAVGGVPGWEFFRMVAEMESTLHVPLDVVPLEPENRFTRRILRRGRLIYDDS